MDDRPVVVRPFAPEDERSWLRCRALAFLGTSYFDDVLTEKPTFEVPSVELVAVAGSEAVGVMDVAVNGALATIETVATHPDATRTGIARRMLLAAIGELPPGVETIDAWTREDQAANGWYQAMGFKETFVYLHVYATGDEIETSVAALDDCLTPVSGFFHARVEAEDHLRRHYRRVYRCRRYERPVQSTSRIDGCS